MFGAILRAIFGESETTDLAEAMEYEGDIQVTHGQLAQKLGLSENPDYIEYYNALLNVQGNEAVQNMSHDERVRTIAEAAAALGHLEEIRRTGEL